MIKQVLRSADQRLMPWKNGLGLTREIFREPLDDAEAFVWRASIAEVAANSSFSSFPGLTRIINTLEGEGMRLKVDGLWAGPLLKYDPFVFSGDSAVESELLGGPIRDFNLIYDPRLCSARLQWLDLDRPRVFCSQAEAALIFAVGRAEVETGECRQSLNSHDSILLRGGRALPDRIQVSAGDSSGENHCCLIEISRRRESSQ